MNVLAPLDINMPLSRVKDSHLSETVTDQLGSHAQETKTPTKESSQPVFGAAIEPACPRKVPDLTPSEAQIKASRLRMRLKLAYYKVQTNQIGTALDNLPAPNTQLSFSSALSSKSNKQILSHTTPVKQLGRRHNRDGRRDRKRDNDTEQEPLSFSSSPFKSLTGSAVKCTPISLGAAKSLLRLGLPSAR
ncbi:hypothetical protein CANCADRAFT_44054 [Tortispora caseinolytica NRRL Y-17796]|uniref:Uncharacterized protein n=1 Tax=Tortispora caseinolytica NRRL Y-17796 TaxID=767744 RepID=A0A1E4TFB4_9ASCO|nr:hypothetical protein CANCADRAFT_44054 [Tortispora caseinolytica NRRL Y-17796]